MPDYIPNQKCKIRFVPDQVEIIVGRETPLLDAAISGSVHIAASCGGSGTCGTCKVKILSGEVKSDRTTALSDEEYRQGFRLACRSKVLTDLLVSVPVESRHDEAVRSPGGDEPSGEFSAGYKLAPPLKKFYLELPPPTLSDNTSDLSRLLRGLQQDCGFLSPAVEFDVLRRLPEVLRQDRWKVTVTTLAEPPEPEFQVSHQTRIVDIEAGYTLDRQYALAVDVGTTTVCAQLLDLRNGVILAEGIVFNKQTAYGADVIARIAFIQKSGPPGLKRCQEAVIQSINEVIDSVTGQSGVRSTEIGHITLAGNTTMTQILLGLDPQYIRLSPYVPAANFFPAVKAASLGIKASGQARVYVFPVISAYVGGDITAGIIAAGIHRSQKLTFYMDIGTNGEIVIGHNDWMVTASCSAGPAFEGGGIRHGMVAANGAIQDLSIDPVSLEPVLRTIGGARPGGICGSGLISAIAGLLESGIIDRNGKFNRGLNSPRVREGEDGYEYVLAAASETLTGRDIVITEVDIDNLIRAKAALYAGCHTLCRSVNITCTDFERVILAGNFGSSLNIEKAVTIGLLPDIPRDRFTFIGNGSLSGTRLASFSQDLLNESYRAARMMTNIELSDSPEFTENYIAASFLPHTDSRRFPSVNRRLNQNVRAASRG